MKSKSDLARIAPALSDEVCGLVVKLGKSSGNQITFKCHKSLAETFEQGDLAVCQGGPHGDFSILEVISVDPTFEPEDHIVYKWAFARVDREPLDKLIEWENALVEALYTAQRKQARQSMIAALGIDAEIPSLPSYAVDKKTEA